MIIRRDVDGKFEPPATITSILIESLGDKTIPAHPSSRYEYTDENFSCTGCTLGFANFVGAVQIF